ALFGADGVALTLRPGSVVIASATVSPEYPVRLGRRLRERQVWMLDAPVSGGAAKTAAGEMTMMTSDPAEAYAACEDVLSAIAQRIYRLGDEHGLGSKVKIVNQLLAGVHIAAAAEAMALGLREGVDPERLYEVIINSAGNSWMFENRVPHILAGDFRPLSAVDIFVKDLRLVLDTARASKFPLPLSAAAHQMFMMASTAGYAREDDAAVVKIFPGVRLPAAQA
ncbi:MAG TPA: L-threonate dehydrogenase, partial [Opitutaceae bacterium]